MQLKQRTTITVEELARAYGISRLLAYQQAEELGAIRVGRRLIVPVAPLAQRLGVSAADLLARLEEGESDA